MTPFSVIPLLFNIFRGGGGIASVVERAVDALKKVGAVKTPEEEIALRKIVAQEYDAWAKMTTPPWERVAGWANTYIATARYNIIYLLFFALVFWPTRLLESIKVLHEAGPAGFIVLAILAWLYYGRQLEKAVEQWALAWAIKWGGPEAAKVMPHLVPALPQPSPKPAKEPVPLADGEVITPFEIPEEPRRSEFER